MAAADDDLPPGIRSRMATLRGLLSSQSQFVVPPFQRAYAWGEDEVERLLRDLGEACEQGQRSYFLGTTVSQETEEGAALVIDGHQRKMTLVLILAQLRDGVGDPKLSAELQALIAPGGKQWTPRLLVRRADQDLVREMVLTPGRLKELADVKHAPSPSQRQLCEAARTVMEYLAPLPAVRQRALADYLCRRLIFNVIEADSDFSISLLFRVLNQRGLKMPESALVKSQILLRAKIPREEAEILSDRWDDWEVQLGEQSFEDLLRLTPLIITGDDANRPDGDLGFFYTAAFTRDRATQFVRDDVWAYLKAYRDLTSGDLDGGDLTEEIYRLSQCLLLYRDKSCLAPAVAFVAAHAGDPPAVLRFLRGLERLCFARAMGLFNQQRAQARIARVVAANGDEEALYGKTGALNLTPAERRNLIERINAPIRSNEHRRRVLVLRANAALGEVLLCPHTEATVEHVKPLADTPHWRAKFPRESEVLTHILGNFTIVKASQNDQAANLTYEEKRKVYFHTRRAPIRALTRHLEPYKDWSELELKDRHHDLVTTLCEEMDLI